MRKFLKLMSREFALLYRTIFLIGIIMIVFVAALLSVISVLLDVPEGMYSGLDDYMTVFNLRVSTVSSDFSKSCGGTPVSGGKYGITSCAVLTGKSGSLKTTPPPVDRDKKQDDEPQELELRIERHGLTVSAQGSPLAAYDQALQEGSRWPQNTNEITLSSDLATSIGAEIGESVKIGPDNTHAEKHPSLNKESTYSYTVVGIFDRMKAAEIYSRTSTNCPVPVFYYYTSLDPQMTMTWMEFAMPNARALHDTCIRLQNEGYGASFGSDLVARQFDNIAMAKAFFGAVSGVLGAMVLFIEYSLIAIFFRQRRKQICRLKLLGATSGTIAMIYCSIAIVLVIISVVAGAAFSMAFNVYFMNLCGMLFNKFSTNFVSHFRPVIPAILFLVLATFTMLLFFLVNLKVKNTAVAEEVRHE